MHWIPMPEFMSYRRCFLYVNLIGKPLSVLPLYLTPLAADAGAATTASATSAVRMVMVFLMGPLLLGWLADMRPASLGGAPRTSRESPIRTPMFWGGPPRGLAATPGHVAGAPVDVAGLAAVREALEAATVRPHLVDVPLRPALGADEGDRPSVRPPREVAPEAGNGSRELAAGAAPAGGHPQAARGGGRAHPPAP